MGGTSPPYSQRRYFEFRIFTTCKRILGQSNIFAPVCHSVHRGVLSQHALQVVSRHALQQVSGGGVVVSQHALQVSRPTPKGEVEGNQAWGVSRPTPKGEVQGIWPGGVSRPTPKGEVEGDLAGVSPDPHLGGSPDPHPGGVSRPTPRGSPSPHRGGGLCPGPGQGGSQHALRQTPPHSRRLLLRAVRILLECILVNQGAYKI